VQLQRSSQFHDAMLRYQDAIELKYDFPEAHQNLGHLYELIGQFDQCKYHHELSINYAVTNQFKAYAINNLVLIEIKIMMKMKNGKERFHLQQLINLLSIANELLPNQDMILYTTASVYDILGDTYNHLLYLNKVLATNAHHALALLNMGKNHNYFHSYQCIMITSIQQNIIIIIYHHDSHHHKSHYHQPSSS